MAKDQTILIRIEPELKERFRQYCIDNNKTVTEVLRKKIQQTLDETTTNMLENQKSPSMLVKELVFYKNELQRHKEMLAEIKNISVRSHRHYQLEQVKFFIDLLIDHFGSIQAFKNLMIENGQYITTSHQPDILAIDKTSGKKVCIELIPDLSFKTKSKPRMIREAETYTEWNEKNDVREVIIVMLNSITTDAEHYIEKVSSMTPCPIRLFQIDELLDYDELV